MQACARLYGVNPSAGLYGVLLEIMKFSDWTESFSEVEISLIWKLLCLFVFKCRTSLIKRRNI